MNKGVTPSGSGHSDEPASGLAADAGSVPNAGRWLPRERSPIWEYARAMRSSLQKLLPRDAVVGFRDGGLVISATVSTMQEAEAVREVIRHLGQTLPSTRRMVAKDIGADIKEPDWRDALYKALGVPAQGIETRSAEIAQQTPSEG